MTQVLNPNSILKARKVLKYHDLVVGDCWEVVGKRDTFIGGVLV